MIKENPWKSFMRLEKAMPRSTNPTAISTITVIRSENFAGPGKGMHIAKQPARKSSA